MSKEYHAFMASEKKRLRDIHPHYSTSTIASIARDEWKATKGCGSSIKSRYGTIKYEINKALIERVPQYDMSQHEDIQKIFVDGKCVYCQKQLHSRTKGKGDHILPVQAKSCKPVLTNFSAFTMPCCVACNTSRGNKPLKEFVNSNSKYKSNMHIFDRFETIMSDSIVHYEADPEEYDACLEYSRKALEHICMLSQKITIKQVTTPFKNFNSV